MMRVLIVDDEALLASAIARKLGQRGYRCERVGTLAAARVALSGAEPPELVLLDVRLPDGNGLSLLEARPNGAGPAFIVLTAFGAIEDAVAAMKLGASDYLKKPIDLEELIVAIGKLVELRTLRDRITLARTRDAAPREEAAILGDSPPLVAAREELRTLAQVGDGDAALSPTVLILGETGTGKDLAARCLHNWSRRAAEPFVQVDCSTLPRDLIDAELFGHAKGAFTGASEARAGLIEAAEGGTLFLDEIGELPNELQAKLLGVLERRVTRRLGSTIETQVRARFIAATNRDLVAMVAARQFREDLYYRLKVMTVRMPPLRACRADIAPLVRRFAQACARHFGRPAPDWSPPSLARLEAHDWPGNMRELKHLVERVTILNRGRPVEVRDLALDAAAPPPGAGADPFADLTLEAAERMLIERALAASHGNVSEAARRLDVTRMVLRNRIEKYGLAAEREPPKGDPV